MSKPSGRCAFCASNDLTKSHIWPAWAQKVVPSTAKQYEITTGTFHTFVPNTATEGVSRTTKAGSVANRRPRNTCLNCNSGWMRDIEEYAKPYITGLMRGDRLLLEAAHQYAIAAFLSLVSIRIDTSNKLAHPIPIEDYQHLIEKREPGPSWMIWIMKFTDGVGDDYWYNHFPMAMKAFPEGILKTMSPQQLSLTAEDTNTQVTTIVVGRLCAHIFSTTAYHDFIGYEAPAMCPVWPTTGLSIDTRWLPSVNTEEVKWLHEAIGRDRNPPDRFKIV